MSFKQDLIFHITARRFTRGIPKAECLAGRVALGRMTAAQLHQVIAREEVRMEEDSYPSNERDEDFGRGDWKLG